MPGSSTTPGRSDLAMVRPKRVAFRTRNGVGTRGLAFAAQWLAYQLGAPGHVIARMLGNVALDGVFGAVPLIGDAFDALWRGRNVRLLREWLDHERRR